MYMLETYSSMHVISCYLFDLQRDLHKSFVTCRAMDFLVELFRNLIHHQDWSMSQACSDAYAKTLKKWHGWLASSSFSVRTLNAYYLQLKCSKL